MFRPAFGLALAAVAALAAPAAACLNDSELVGHEREFRSDYRGPAEPPAASPPAPEPVGPIVWAWGSGGVGVVLLSVGLWAAWRGAPARG